MSSAASASAEPVESTLLGVPPAGEATTQSHKLTAGSESNGVAAPAEAHACCAQGTVHVGKTAGFETKLAGLDVYVVHPTSASAEASADAPPRTTAHGGSALILLHDMFGWKLPNSRLLADRFAAAMGVTVYLPDFFRGEQLHPADWDHLVAQRRGFFSKVAQGVQFFVALPKLISFMKRHGAPVVRPHMDRFVAHLRAVEGAARIGAVGYCWGGRYAVLLTHPQAAAAPATATAAADATPVAAAGGAGAAHTAASSAATRPFIDVAVSCHPSLLEVPVELAPSAAPILFVCAEKDDLFTPAVVATAKRVAEQKSKAAAAAGGAGADAISFTHYPGTRHGFAVRGDDSEPAVAAARQKAFDDALAFLKPVLVVNASASAPSGIALVLAVAVEAAASPASADAATRTSVAAFSAAPTVSDAPVSD